MPEIAEVARIVHYLKQRLACKTLKVVQAQDDSNVFGKVGTSAAEFQKSLTGKKVLDAGQQGKYFWLIMSSPPHPVFHFGMSGWMYIRGEPSMHYRPKEMGDSWPPKYWKFALETDGVQKVEAAFTDSRRFGRIRLVDCAAEDIRNTTPLKENGPDPVIDRDILTEEWLEKKMLSKHVPVKALLLDQANISGIGNWVGDEILYHAKLHPAQYSNTFTSAQLKQLHTSMMYVCKTAVDLLADSSKFPEEWLFNHRWGKGKKDSPTCLPDGTKITHITVGGRTSCIVPSVQKKSGTIASDLKNEDVDSDALPQDQDTEPLKPKKNKTTAKKSEYFHNDGDAEIKAEKPRKERKVAKRKDLPGDLDTATPAEREETKMSKKRRVKASPSGSNIDDSKVELSSNPAAPTDDRRRSGRISKQQS